MQEPKLLRPNFRRDEADPGGVTTGPVEAGDEAVSDRVAPGRKHDRHRRRCGLRRERGRGVANDERYLPTKKVRHQKRQPVSLTLVRTVLNRDVLALDEACFLEALAERSHALVRNRSTAEKPDDRHCRLLRVRCERPRRRAAEQRDEIAPLHSITSSARARKDSGIVRPSFFAALMLTTSSNLVA